MSTATAPVPFFKDTRTLTEKLACEKREWRPAQPEHNCQQMIFGLVLERGTYTSSYGNQEARETARILTDANVEWSVIAFHGYLQSEFSRKAPEVGDFVAIAYTGTKPARKPGENDANMYAMEVERNPLVPHVSHEVERKTMSVTLVEQELDEDADTDPTDGIPF